MTASPTHATRTTPHASDRLMLREYLHWRRLIGATVQIRHNGRIIRTGTVDEAMSDSTALWIAADATQPRTLYEAAHGIEVWRERTNITTRPAPAVTRGTPPTT